MYIDLLDIVIALFLFLAIFTWWHNIKFKERAFLMTKRHCLSLGVQLLDDSIAGSEWKIVWQDSQFKIKRCYQFEFTSTGTARYKGTISFIGSQLIEIWLSPHHI